MVPFRLHVAHQMENVSPPAANFQWKKKVEPIFITASLSCMPFLYFSMRLYYPKQIVHTRLLYSFINIKFMSYKTQHYFYYYSCGTTEGHKLTKAQHTFTILCIVELLSWLSRISEIPVGIVFCKMVYFFRLQ